MLVGLMKHLGVFGSVGLLLAVFSKVSVAVVLVGYLEGKFNQKREAKLQGAWEVA